MKILGSTVMLAALAGCDVWPFGSSAQADVIGKDASGKECVLDPTETAGPFPADGSNNANGALADAIKNSGILRSDIKTNIDGSGEPASGVPLDLEISLVDVNDACKPLPGCAVYLWHCDVNGQYSIYNLPDKSYLRGVGMTDESGLVKFSTIFPGCYSGRYPHMHFEIYPTLEQATSYENALLTSQIAMPPEACLAVYTSQGAYAQSKVNFSNSSLEKGGIFSNNTERQLAAQTPALSGDAATGFTGRLTIGVTLRS